MERNEAIKSLRQLYSETNAENKAALECFIPELRESEDECLENKSGYYKAGKFWKASTLWNATKDKIPQRVSNRCILQGCTWNIGTLQQFAHEVKNVQGVSLDYPIILDMNGNILDGAHRVVKAYLEGKDIDVVYLGDDEWPEPDYDEEKAVKESEDERIRKELIQYLTDYPTIPNGQYSRYDFFVYLENQKEQKPAEWSGEDEKMLASFLHKVEVCDLLTNKENVWIVERLKSLRPQPKQEWTEDDRRKLNRIFQILGQAAEDKGFLTSKRIIGDKEAVELQDFIRDICFSSKAEALKDLPKWKKASAGTKLPSESVIRAEGQDPRFGMVAMYDCEYITVNDLKKLPKED